MSWIPKLHLLLSMTSGVNKIPTNQTKIQQRKIEYMDQKKIVKNLILAAQKIEESRISKANHIFLSEDFIQEQADKRGISFDAMIEVIENELSGKNE